MRNNDKLNNYNEQDEKYDIQTFKEDIKEEFPSWERSDESFFTRVKNYVRFGSEEVPEIINLRFRAFLMMAVAVAVGGSFMMLLMHSYLAILFCFVFGLLVAVYGYSIMLSATKRGYDIITGECIRIDYRTNTNPFNNAGIPKRFIVMDTDGNKAYALPFYKRGVLVEEGDLVRIFVPKDVFLYDRGSITNFSEVWGYEVVPELNEDRNRRLGIED